MDMVFKAFRPPLIVLVTACLGGCSHRTAHGDIAGMPAAERQPFNPGTPGPLGGRWDVEPRSIKAADLTPLSRCTLFWTAADGATFGQLATGTDIFFVVAKPALTFPELTAYQAVLSSPAGKLNFSMQPEAGRSLSVPVSFQNDPGGVLPKILNSGFRLTVTGQSAGLQLDDTAAPVPFGVQLANGLCLMMNQAAAKRHWTNPPVAHTP